MRELAFDGADAARAAAGISGGAAERRLRAVVICPSNPFISVEPILAVPGMRDAIAACGAPVIAVSPIIGGRAVKGPTAKMMRELGLAVERRRGRRALRRSADGYVMDAGDDADGRRAERASAPPL